MKIRPPVILILFTLIACSMPGYPVPAGDSNRTIPAALNDTPSAVKTVTASAGTPVLTPASVIEFPVITLKNVGSLRELKSNTVENINRLAWYPDSKSLAILTEENLSTFDATTLKKTRDFQIPPKTYLLDFDPDSRLMALTSNWSGLEIRSFDGSIVQTISPGIGFRPASFENGGKHIWISSSYEIVAISVDTSNGTIFSCADFETAAPVYSASPSTAGKYLVWIARASLQVDTLESCKLVSHISFEDFISAHAFSAGDSLLAVSTGGELDGVFQPLIYVYDPVSGTRKMTIPIKETPAMDLSFSPDSSILAGAGSGVFLLDVQTGKVLKDLAASDQRFTAAAFSPDGRLFAAADETSLHIYAVSR